MIGFVCSGYCAAIAHEAGGCILFREGSDAFFPNDFGGGGEDLLYYFACSLKYLTSWIKNNLILPWMAFFLIISYELCIEES